MTHSQQVQQDLYQAEYIRQTTAYSLAIDKAIETEAAQFESPIINAVAAAIVMAEAQLLASVPDPSARQALLEAMNKLRPQAFEKTGATMKVELIIKRDDEVLQ